MGILDPIKPTILAARLIPNIHPDFAAKIGLRPDQRSLALITCDIDDSLYVSLDEATKKAEVEVVYARSFYAGARHSSGTFSGEIIAMLAGPDPAELRSGLDAALRYLETRALWYSAAPDDGVAFFPHVVPQIGSYLARVSGLPPKSSIAYLVAPPLEGCLALDAALKAAAVEIAAYTAPPSETNFMGAILWGEESACEAAALAFQETVLDAAAHPLMY